MTYREAMKQLHPDLCGPDFVGGCAGCPGDVVAGAPHLDDNDCLLFPNCDECWDQPMEQDAKKDPTE